MLTHREHALYMPRDPGLGQNSRYFVWALRMVRNRGTQLVTSEEGLEQGEKCRGRVGEPTPGLQAGLG